MTMRFSWLRFDVSGLDPESPLVISSGGGAGVEKSAAQFVPTNRVPRPLPSAYSSRVLFLAEMVR